MVMQFLEAGARLNSILTKIDAGEGTLGLLLNDPTLYEELKRLVGGAGRSTVVRSLIDMVAPAEDP
jgi:phospholipid/cholesterol/gamma-HCH transport system substrate-binding protein